jgi:hypothetical protein
LRLKQSTIFKFYISNPNFIFGVTKISRLKFFFSISELGYIFLFYMAHKSHQKLATL